MKKLFAIFLLCGTIQQISAQGIRVPPQPPATLQPGSLQIRLSGVPPEDAEEINAQHFDIAADGSVTLPHIGAVKVAGLTASQAEHVIERAYVDQGIYRWPTVTINVGSSARPHQGLDAPGPGYREYVKPLHSQSFTSAAANEAQSLAASTPLTLYGVRTTR